MSDPADSPAPRPEDAENRVLRDETPSEPPQSGAPSEPPRPETPMEDSRPEAHDASGPAQAEPVPNGSEHPTPPQALTADAATGKPRCRRNRSRRRWRPQARAPRARGTTQHPPPYLQQQQPGPYYQVPPPPPRVLPPNPRWHRPESIPMQAVVIMAVAVALFGSWAAFPGDGVGIGLALTGIAMVAVPLAAGSREDLVPRLPGAVLVAALWSVAAIRDAGWVVFLCSFAAFACDAAGARAAAALQRHRGHAVHGLARRPRGVVPMGEARAAAKGRTQPVHGAEHVGRLGDRRRCSSSSAASSPPPTAPSPTSSPVCFPR